VTKPLDDLEAVRQLVATLEPFAIPERERIIRWAREKLGMAAASPTDQPTPSSQHSPPVPPHPAGGPLTSSTPATDLKTFVATKKPKNDTQLVATIAYFYKFTATEAERKDAISSADLLDACRKADYRRPSRPAQTLINAFKAGVVDKAGTGSYKINSVGENLVAMVLPGDSDESKKPKRSTPRRAKAGKKSAAAKRKASPRNGGRKTTPKKPVSTRKR
jgi:hypothetical protein